MQVLHTLREAIIAGAIPQGARITEDELSKEMDVSRSTVRSALQQLSVEGLTVLKRYAGWSVQSLSAEDVWELYTLRSALERLAARLVSENIDQTKYGYLEKALENLVNACQQEDWVKISAEDYRFHRQIVLMAGNQRLTSQYNLIEPQIRMYITALDPLFEEVEIVISQHTAITRAILSGDVEAAGRLSEVHNLVDGRKLQSHLERGSGITIAAADRPMTI